MKIFTIVKRIISRSRYLIVVVAGIVIVGFMDENSFVRRVRNAIRIHELKEQIAEYNEQYKRDEAMLREIRHNPDAVARIAREKYFMKKDDEDVFVLREASGGGE